MPRASHLTQAEKGAILALSAVQLSIRAIAKKINRSESCVRSFLKHGNVSKQPQRPGRPKKLGARDLRRLARAATEPGSSANSLIRSLNLSVSKSTVVRALNNSGIFKYTKRAHSPKLSKDHKMARVEFAKKMLKARQDWRRVVFTDEKKFNLDGPDGWQYYWHDLRKEPEFFFSRVQGGGSVMVWAGVSAAGKTEIAVLEGRQNSEKYIKTLKDYMLPLLEANREKKLIFQQDGASIHTSNKTKQWIVSQQVELLPWPSKSPDLNITENVWGMLARSVYHGGKQFNTVNKLKCEIFRSWRQIQQIYLNKLVDGMTERCIDVISHHGTHIKKYFGVFPRFLQSFRGAFILLIRLIFGIFAIIDDDLLK